MLKDKHKCCTECGSTMINMVVAIGLIGILSAIAVPNLKSISNPLNDASILTKHFLKLARARAISETKSLRVSPGSSTSIKVEESDSCDGSFTLKSNLFLYLPKGASFNDINWEVCFSPRGLASSNSTFLIQNTDGKIKTIEVALGGGTRIQ